jgi:23S rRNA pseudouridine1911/1915/1917 synthase
MKEHVTPDEAGRRLDAWLAARRPELSRARWQDLIKDGHVLVNDAPRKANYAVRGGDAVAFEVPAARPTALAAEDIPLDVLYEDGDLLVINKPPGLVVHPAPGHDAGTLVNALLHRCKDLAGIGGERRPGIVHRLDRDTSGALVVAKNEAAMAHLAAQFKNRSVAKEYVALVQGAVARKSGRIATLIGRSPRDRKKMSARVTRGRDAVSNYEVVEQFESAALVRVRIETGRTHQIRVHMAHLGHPVLGDEAYGRARTHDSIPSLPRQMLHAERIAFRHPRTGVDLRIEAPWPEDFRTAVEALRSSPQGRAV